MGGGEKNQKSRKNIHPWNYVPSWNKKLDDIYNKDHGYNVKINILKEPVKKTAKKASTKVKNEEGNKAKNKAVDEPSTSSE